MAVAVPTPQGDPKSGASANQPLVPDLDASLVASREDDARRMRAIAKGDKGVFEQVYDALEVLTDLSHVRHFDPACFRTSGTARDDEDVISTAVWQSNLELASLIGSSTVATESS